MKHDRLLKKDRLFKTDKTQPTKIIPLHSHGNITGNGKKNTHMVRQSNTLLPPQQTGYMKVKKHDHL